MTGSATGVIKRSKEDKCGLVLEELPHRAIESQNLRVRAEACHLLVITAPARQLCHFLPDHIWISRMGQFSTDTWAGCRPSVRSQPRIRQVIAEARRIGRAWPPDCGLGHLTGFTSQHAK